MLYFLLFLFSDSFSDILDQFSVILVEPDNSGSILKVAKVTPKSHLQCHNFYASNCKDFFFLVGESCSSTIFLIMFLTKLVSQGRVRNFVVRLDWTAKVTPAW